MKHCGVENATTRRQLVWIEKRSTKNTQVALKALGHREILHQTSKNLKTKRIGFTHRRRNAPNGLTTDWFVVIREGLVRGYILSSKVVEDLLCNTWRIECDLTKGSSARSTSSPTKESLSESKSVWGGWLRGGEGRNGIMSGCSWTVSFGNFISLDEARYCSSQKLIYLLYFLRFDRNVQ